MGKLDLVVVGGCGHAGLPLALSFADGGLRVGICDVNENSIAEVKAGRVPFAERGAEPLLRKVLDADRLEFSPGYEIVGQAPAVVVVIGTPIDEFMNPTTAHFDRVMDGLIPHLREDALVILRSTVYPGSSEHVQQRIAAAGSTAHVVFCPERIAEGHALEEIRSLPQIVGASTDESYAKAAALFSALDVELVRTTPTEAEVAKLVTNTWRYFKFAIANQFFQVAHRAGLDYGKILDAVRYHYPRAADLPAPGFAAGPCLLKDTMQLAAFSSSAFPLGHAAMLVNEGLPAYIIDTLESRRPLSGTTLGILGMAFKGDSDDNRSSLSYKLKKLAIFRGAQVLCADPYVKDPSLLPQDDVLHRSDVVVIGAPHTVYKDLKPNGAEVIDIWGVTGAGIKL